jgi:hypothetical protein
MFKGTSLRFVLLHDFKLKLTISVASERRAGKDSAGNSRSCGCHKYKKKRRGFGRISLYIQYFFRKMK